MKTIELKKFERMEEYPFHSNNIEGTDIDKKKIEISQKLNLG